ncbi:TIGR02679 family protein [Micromonospora sp. NPDC050200]|uniref:TIGR02679 family protein n=1 Tax=Micromonospora sp. NPDC050200 TaxID=3155664 RepID=UPI00340289B7
MNTPLAWLGSPELGPLWSAVRLRLIRNGRAARGRLSLRALDDRQREAVGLLIGRPVAAQVTLDLAELDRALASSAAAAGLIEVVEALTGPVPDRPADAAAEVTRRDQLREHGRVAVEAAGIADRDWAARWLDSLWRSGVLARLTSAEARRLITAATTALGLTLSRRSTPWSRTELAERVTGTAHGLDDDTLLARLVLRGIALALTGSAEPPPDAAARRALWESAGVAGDTVATTVLTYGLRPLADDWLARSLRQRADQHAETHLTLRDVRRLGHLLIAQDTVYVCENPRVLEAAVDAAAPAALVCTSGNPTTVTLALLDALAAQDRVRLTYHGDFDWPGIGIAERVMRRTGALPWRFRSTDYEAAIAEARLRGTPLRELSGPNLDTPWDPALAAAMRRHARVVHEESVVAALLGDLMNR